jgi:spore coat polysaccharide biosynthesis protein SpsF
MTAHTPALFVLGSAQFGMAYGAANRSGMPSASQAQLLIRAAARAGVRWIDTAAAYGEAEARIGTALHNLQRVRVVTKLSPFDHFGADTSASEIVHAVDASILQSVRNLRTTMLDTLLLHRSLHRTAHEGRIWRRLLTHRSAGTVYTLGVSVYTPEEALDALNDPAVHHIQLPMNLLDWRWREADLQAALKKRPNVIVHARSVFLQGLLAGSHDALWPQIPGVAGESVIEKLSRLANDLGRTGPADLCLAYVRGQPWIHGAAIGLETATQLALNLDLFKRAPLNPAECRFVEQRLPRAPEVLLNPALWPKAA